MASSRVLQAARTTIAVLVLALAVLADPLAAATFTVLNTADSGVGSLREAIANANGLAGADDIPFAIPGAGVHTITLLTALPQITSPVVIDGYTQPGSSPNTLATGSNAVLLIELNGNGGGFTGLNVATTANGTILRGLVVNRFSTGIALNGANDEVHGCFVGVDPTGTIDLGNGSGIRVNAQGADDVRIGSAAPADRNVVSGNDGIGIRSIGDRTHIVGNYVGTNAAGTAAIGNVTGVEVAGDDAVVGGANATPGGACSGACNLISGNSGTALRVDLLFGPAFRADVRGNYIGTDVSGLAAVPNVDGILLGSARLTTVGAVAGTAADRNVIAGNSGRGIFSNRNGATNPVTSLNTLARNYIGLNASGAALGNGGRGIELTDAFQNDIIENVVAHNGGAGIQIPVGLLTPNTGHIRNRMQRNTVFANGGMGIDLEHPIGPTPNDTADADNGNNGANELQNYPILDSATTVLGTTEVTGRLNSLPNTTFTIEIFGSSTCDTTGFGEAEEFLGDLLVMTDASGNAAVHTFVPAPPGGGPITATATDPNDNTSELSAC
ncbi:MAG TPA: right-handed parallel beta-helix repeat-containing protein, partial [Thermoanaerobaculia bacterium]|nr:right-handed parallel beta-helix repeat-containing protein [Thermoanaerobaculia bacterium]